MDKLKRRFYYPTKNIAAGIIFWVAFFSAVFTVLGFIFLILSLFSDWMNRGEFSFLQRNYEVLWLVTLTSILILLWIWMFNIYHRLVGGFQDNLVNLDNWDFIGLWKLVDKGIISITGSDEGGVTKIGSQWENYTFSFEARIINKCIGVIVRAQDLNNYYMFQIRADKIRPHLRKLIPVLIDEPRDEGDDHQKPIHRPVIYKISWLNDRSTSDEEFQPSPISPELIGWFKVKIEVYGQSIKIWINDELMLQRSNLITFPTGKIGFRNNVSEVAYVKNIKVDPQI